MHKNLEALTNDIANLIVELVEQTDGFVTLAKVLREIPGFAKAEPPAWAFVRQDDAGRDILICDGMTEAGNAALQKVLNERMVAVQGVNELLYMLDGASCSHENWCPIVLLPAKAANMQINGWLVRALPESVDRLVAEAVERKSTYRLITPEPVRFTADQLAVM